MNKISLQDKMLLIIEPTVSETDGVYYIPKLKENTSHFTYLSILNPFLPSHLQDKVYVEESYKTAMEFALSGNIYFSGYDVPEKKHQYEIFLPGALTEEQFHFLEEGLVDLEDLSFIPVPIQMNPDMDSYMVSGKDLLKVLKKLYQKENFSSLKGKAK